MCLLLLELKTLLSVWNSRVKSFHDKGSAWSPSPLLSPPTSTLECILAASGSVAAPLWLEKELFLYGKAEEQLRKKVKEINMFTPSNSRDFFSVFKPTSFWSLTSQWSIMSYSSMETLGLCKLLQKSRFVLSTFLILFIMATVFPLPFQFVHKKSKHFPVSTQSSFNTMCVLYGKTSKSRH